jgi:hypothetical protein
VKKKKLSKQKEQRRVDHSKHPKYDEVVKKMRKILGAATSFIPDACEALRQDWYPEINQEQIKHDSEARDDIREQVLIDWSYERNDTQGVWSDLRIQFCFPDWLRNPNKQTADYLEKAAANSRMGYLARKFGSASIQIEAQKPAIEKLVQKLPEPINIPEPQAPELQIPDEPEGSDEPIDPAEVREITIHQLDTELVLAEKAILKALANRRNLFHEIASSSNKNLARLSINGHIEQLDKIREDIEDTLRILQKIEI